MKKHYISFDHLYLEMTRRCNMACKHCLRGDAQDLDISYETIDILTDKVRSIEKITLGGGEPTLAIDKIEYLFRSIIRKNIIINRIDIITNGLIKSNKLVELLKQMHDYMVKNGYGSKRKIIIGVSDDPYHDSDPDEAYFFYKIKFHGYKDVDIRRKTAGYFTVKKGRAIKNVPTARPKYVYNHRHEILSKNTKPICPYFKDFKLMHDEQLVILCSSHLNVAGDATYFTSIDSYDDVDNPERIIFNISDDDIEGRIKEFNKHMPYCFEDKEVKERNEKFNDYYFELYGFEKAMNLLMIEDISHPNNPDDEVEEVKETKPVDVEKIGTDELIRQCLEYNYKE